MGRIVYFSFPAYGHINPTLPVVRELGQRGHELVYYCLPRFRDSVECTGVGYRSYCPQFSMPEQGPGRFAQVTTALEALLDLSCSVLEHQLEEVRSLGPTHVMYDSFAPWGSLVAQLLDLPTIASVPSILVNGDIAAHFSGSGEPKDPRLTAEWYAGFESRCRAAWSRYGLPTRPAPAQLIQTYADLSLVYTSRSFQPLASAFAEDRFQFVGPCFEFRPPPPVFPFERLDGRPLVFVSLGTVYGNQPGFLGSCLQQLADDAWQVVMATGGYGVESGEQLPENCIVQPLVPQIEILRRAAVFVTHGGMNSVQEALYHGVPMVMAPQGADQFWVSARTAEVGAGVVLEAAATGAGGIRNSVAKVFEDKSFAANAERQGQSLRMAGGHVRAADAVERFVQSGASVNGQAAHRC